MQASLTFDYMQTADTSNISTEFSNCRNSNLFVHIPHWNINWNGTEDMTFNLNRQSRTFQD